MQTGERSPSWREAILLNGGARIIECNSAEGEVQMAVMPGDLPHLLAGLELLRSDRMLLMRPGDRLPATGYSAATR